jgi:lipoprotein NlpD
MNRKLPILMVVGVLTLLAGCTTTSLSEAPIVDRSERREAPAALPAQGPAGAPALTREAADGSYVVQRGDTLYSIALAFGQDYRDLARWNGLQDPSRLQVGQALRVQAPADATASVPVAAVPVAPVVAADVRPLDVPLPPVAPAPATPTVLPQAASAPPAPSIQAPSVVTAPLPPKAGDGKPAPAVAMDSSLRWAWPAGGKVVDTFDEARNKGIDIAGKEGEPVLAAGDGQVVYKGSALRGYGNLVIIKHSDDFVSAYAHNRQILVEYGDSVKRGQRIAEMGRSDAEIPKLHFEIRRQGKPVDPLKLLPAR